MTDEIRQALDADRHRRCMNEARPFALGLGIAAAWAAYQLTGSAGVLAWTWFGVYMGTLIVCTESLNCLLRRRENHQ
jgi:hypothetical protein